MATQNKMITTKPIKTALCSFGMSGRVFHAPFLNLLPQFDFASVLERTKNEAVKLYPSVKTYRTFDALLADETIELVVVNTPSVTHFDMAKQALNAGKHVVVEKPFTATVAEADVLIALAEKHGKMLSVYHNRRWDSDFQTVQAVINAGKLGQIVDCIINFDRYVPGLSAKAHKEKPTPAVGNLYDLGSHLIDQARQLFGMPDALFADIATNRTEALVDDYFDIKLFYPKHRVTLRSSYFVKENQPGFQVHGKQGSFIKSRADVQEKDLVAGVTPGTANWGVEPVEEEGVLHYVEEYGKSIREKIKTLRGNYGTFYTMLAAAISDNKALPVTPQEARNVIQIIEAAQKSAEEKKVIQL